MRPQLALYHHTKLKFDGTMENPQYITEADVKLIIAKCGFSSETIIENVELHHASDIMLGFLADYVKLQILITSKNQRERLCFFIKAISRVNPAKATMVKELRLFEKELRFYDVIKRNMEVPGLKRWCAKFVAHIEDAVVFQDLTAMQYKVRSRHDKFDRQHTLQALDTLARFHATTIIFEEKKTKELKRPYRVNDEYGHLLDKGGYVESDPWFVQCRTGPLEAVKQHSKHRHNKELMKTIEKRWCDVFNSALTLSNTSSEHRSVICHRDLWCNNILFHYSSVDGNSEPDDCVLVDFQAVRCQPPAGDVMLLLHCNLEPHFRKDNLNTFLHYYYDQLEAYLQNYGIIIENITTRDKFMKSALEQNLWGLVTHACLVQTNCLDDALLTNIFSDSVGFDEIMTKDKATFINTMIQENDSYQKAVMEVFEEVVEHYCLNKN